ncbi:MAG: hypothetical protein ACM3RP_07095 [Chitinophagales bacterium]
MTTTAKGRARQQALLDLLDRYPAATTDQLAALLWRGDQRLARRHLLAAVRAHLVRRVPHPLYRNGAYVYSRSGRSTSHSQKVLHNLAAVDFHLAVTRSLGRYGARTVPELPWAPWLIPDQTVLWRESVWAVEHHLSGAFSHGPDYQRFMEEEVYTLCHWWRPGLRLGLLVITAPVMLDHVRAQLRRHDLSGLTWRIGTRENVLRDPGPSLKLS